MYGRRTIIYAEFFLVGCNVCWNHSSRVDDQPSVAWRLRGTVPRFGAGYARKLNWIQADNWQDVMFADQLGDAEIKIWSPTWFTQQPCFRGTCFSHAKN